MNRLAPEPQHLHCTGDEALQGRPRNDLQVWGHAHKARSRRVRELRGVEASRMRHQRAVSVGVDQFCPFGRYPLWQAWREAPIPRHLS